MAQEKYSEAADIFASLGNFKDSRKLVVSFNKDTILTGFHHTVGLKTNGSVVAVGGGINMGSVM